MYFILTIGYKNNLIVHQRCIGYFRHFETAKKRVLDNACDMFEDGYYNYAIVAKLEQGIYPELGGQEVIQCFYYDKNQRYVIPCTIPDGLDTNELYFIG